MFVCLYAVEPGWVKNLVCLPVQVDTPTLHLSICNITTVAASSVLIGITANTWRVTATPPPSAPRSKPPLPASSTAAQERAQELRGGGAQERHGWAALPSGHRRRGPRGRQLTRLRDPEGRDLP